MLNDLSFYLLAVLTLAGAIGAMSLRNLVHCALCAAGAFVGLAGIYLSLNAEFVGVAQLLVYVGAIAILIIFTILLTNGAEVNLGAAIVSPSWGTGAAATLLVLACALAPILSSSSLRRPAPTVAVAPVKKIGQQLMSTCVLPLETTGLLLTAALLGAAVTAMSEKDAIRSRASSSPSPRRHTEEVGQP